MPGPLLFCMKIEKLVYYSVPDNSILVIVFIDTKADADLEYIKSR